MMSYVYILTVSTSLLSIMVIWWSHDTHETNMFKGYHSPWLHHCLYCTYVNDTNWGERERRRSSKLRFVLFLPLFWVMIYLLIFSSLACPVHIYICMYIYKYLLQSISIHHYHYYHHLLPSSIFESYW